LPASEQMNVQVRYGFPAIGTIVNNDPEAIIQFLGSGQLPGHEQKMTDDFLVFPTSLGDPWDHLLGNDQGVNGCLWRNVTNGDTGFILVKDVGRNFPVDDFFKKGWHDYVRSTAFVNRVTWQSSFVVRRVKNFPGRPLPLG